ncbi:YciI family protein [Paucibacter sp. Y2R2-4]|uniref:YciI family protein n=1 Tax=Paucibacter sp. Y2R2-4 TaxID=2893553 RepID=UPI0021E39414|nr:YciI family protein [Paucibacter sp. Y2R2-4]MCV2348778.1 YciI family protein [Paucibacter sp. Y2R2-4]
MPRLPLLKALTLCLASAFLPAFSPVFAQQALPAQPVFDADLAQSVGADDYGMRKYVLVVLKTGPKPMPAGPARDAMFKGHFANINRLAAEGKLALAGPFDGVDGWRGLFILAVSDIEEAKQLAATDPVISSGEMVAEYHKYYGSAALMLVNPAHAKVAKKSF